MPDEQSDLANLISTHRSAGILVDTNLLLVYLIGRCDLAWIASFERTRAFREEDFVLLEALLTRFDKVLTTPNVLTEVSNLTNKMKGDRKDRFVDIFKNRIQRFEERYIASVQASELEYFAKCGLTDAAILAAARNNWLVLSADFRLYGIMMYLGMSCLNFNHVRNSDLLKPE